MQLRSHIHIMLAYYHGTLVREVFLLWPAMLYLELVSLCQCTKRGAIIVKAMAIYYTLVYLTLIIIHTNAFMQKQMWPPKRPRWRPSKQTYCLSSVQVIVKGGSLAFTLFDGQMQQTRVKRECAAQSSLTPCSYRNPSKSDFQYDFQIQPSVHASPQWMWNYYEIDMHPYVIISVHRAQVHPPKAQRSHIVSQQAPPTTCFTVPLLYGHLPFTSICFMCNSYLWCLVLQVDLSDQLCNLRWVVK